LKKLKTNVKAMGKDKPAEKATLETKNGKTTSTPAEVASSGNKKKKDKPLSEDADNMPTLVPSSEILHPNFADSMALAGRSRLFINIGNPAKEFSISGGTIIYVPDFLKFFRIKSQLGNILAKDCYFGGFDNKAAKQAKEG
jgi:hypothetical protein